MQLLDKKWIILIAFLFLCYDLSFSFLQYYHTSLDGDIPSQVLPSEGIQKILDNPLGEDAILHHEKYHNPNRYFAHKAQYDTYNILPIFLQHFVSPIESVFLTTGIFTIATHFLLLLIISVFVIEKFGWNNILVMAGLTPFFMYNKYKVFIGIIDDAPTYVFFYATAMVVLLFALFPPFYYTFYHKKLSKKYRLIYFLLWIPVSIIACLNGPLNPAIVLVIDVVLFLYYIKKANRISNLINIVPKELYTFFIPITFFALYSLYLVQFNSGNETLDGGIIEKYRRVWRGLSFMLFEHFVFSLFIVLSAINYFIISRSKNLLLLPKFKNLYIALLAFSVIYILLLPLGGYRQYRQNYVRYDTMIPIILGIMIWLGISTKICFTILKKKSLNVYFGILIAVLLFYEIADSEILYKDKCQRTNMNKIATSNEDVVMIDSDCYVLSWGPITKKENSYEAAQTMKKWNILKTDKLFYQLPKEEKKKDCYKAVLYQFNTNLLTMKQILKLHSYFLQH